MPHYFFHLYNDLEARDLEGRELPDEAAAHAAAACECREMMAEAVRSERVTLSHRIEVEDVYRCRLFAVSFGEAVTVKGACAHAEIDA